LTALDPNTGWYPEGPLTRFLYPNNTNHVGEGSIVSSARRASGNWHHADEPSALLTKPK
jgi:hypothetical protein